MPERRTHGYTLVEALVALAVGLLLAAAAIAFALAHVRELRALWIQGRVMHELRDAADVIELELRRAGHWRDAAATSWDAGTPPAANPHAALLPAGTAPAGAAQLSYSHDGDDAPLGLRLHDGAIEMLFAGGRWQALTDPGTVQVTHFTITPLQRDVPLGTLCARDTADAPALAQRTLAVAIRGHATADRGIERSVQALVQVRNDVVAGACPP
jgi:prepilin-type N-terminal cleavage/methylation domain-containing protein